jgi:hypothetical protein
MSRRPATARSRLTLLLLLLLVLGLTLPMAPLTAPASPPVPPAARLPRLEFIRPGTVIEDRPPAGWTYLVLKSQPRLPEAARRRVGETTAALATMVFTATTASVERDDQAAGRRYRLARLGVGVGLNVRGRDMIVTPETQRGLGADLGLFARQVLSGVCEKQREVHLVAGSTTGALVDTPAFMPRGRGHAPVILRYVFLVDADTGRLDTLVWRIDLDQRGWYQGVVGPIEWLPPNKQVDCVMQADLNEFTLGVPSERAFAILRIPDGQKQVAIPEALRTAAGAPRLTAETARALDAGLRQLLREAHSTPDR